MLKRIREKLKQGSPLGVGAVIVAVMVALFLVYVSFRNTFGPSEAARAASERVFVCAETGKSFKYRAQPGEKYPVPSPYSGKKSGYPAERCYWTREGKVKQEPTWLLRNNFTGIKGPTFCPDCDRFVDPNAGPAIEGADPPPTREEYMKLRKGRRVAEELDQ